MDGVLGEEVQQLRLRPHRVPFEQVSDPLVPGRPRHRNAGHGVTIQEHA
ncbi:hypothetical protein [Ornithinimicrobium kibberense]